MDGTKLSPYPHHSWLNYRHRSEPRPPRMVGLFESTNHLVSITLDGRPGVRRVSGGGERDWTEQPGTVHFLPADGRQHVFLSAAPACYEFHVFFIPPAHLDACMEDEMVQAVPELREWVAHDDAILASCLRQLACPTEQDDIAAARKDAAARGLMRRIAFLHGGKMPDWHGDDGIFASRVLNVIVEGIDVDLRHAPSLRDAARRAGLSPSHFAKKFRLSTGLSFQRFINRRRIQASLGMLGSDSAPLAEMALGLGFSSQSHFTRVFSDLTGMTPAKYRKQFRRTVG